MKNVLLYLFLAAFAFASCNDTEGGDGTATTPDADTTATLPTDLVTNPGTDGTEVPVGPTTAVTFAENEHNFGQINEGDVVEHVFAFTNNGENDLIITNAKGSCGCTVPYYPTEPIAPGESGEIKVSFNSKGKSGIQRKTVTITANTDPSQTVLNLVSEVSPAEGGATN